MNYNEYNTLSCYSNDIMNYNKKNNGYIQPPVPATPTIAIFQNLKPHAMTASSYQICEKNCSGYKKINQICTGDCNPLVQSQQPFVPGFNDVGYLC